jgi:hypothetical protein
MAEYPEPHAVDEVKVHLMGHEGWTKTERRRAVEVAGRHLYIPEAQQSVYRPGHPMETPSIVTRRFLLVKEAQVVDYKKNELRRELWFEEH